MLVRPGLFVLGLSHLLNGTWMIFAGADWYRTIPGVAATGPSNPHFIVDIGLAYLLSGAGMLLGSRLRIGLLALAGAAWPACHALFHVTEWLADGFPGSVPVAATDLVGVVGTGLLGMYLAILYSKHTGEIR